MLVNERQSLVDWGKSFVTVFTGDHTEALSCGRKFYPGRAPVAAQPRSDRRALFHLEIDAIRHINHEPAHQSAARLCPCQGEAFVGNPQPTRRPIINVPTWPLPTAAPPGAV